MTVIANDRFRGTVRAMNDTPQLPPGVGFQLPAVYIIGFTEKMEQLMTAIENLAASVNSLAGQLSTDVQNVSATLDSELTQIHDALVALEAQVAAGQVDQAAVAAVTAQVDALAQASSEALGGLATKAGSLYEDASAAAPVEPPAEPPVEPGV